MVRGHNRLLTIMRETTAYVVVEALTDKKGLISWEALNDLLMDQIEEKAREAGAAGGVRGLRREAARDGDRDDADMARGLRRVRLG